MPSNGYLIAPTAHFELTKVIRINSAKISPCSGALIVKESLIFANSDTMKTSQSLGTALLPTANLLFPFDCAGYPRAVLTLLDTCAVLTLLDTMVFAIVYASR